MMTYFNNSLIKIIYSGINYLKGIILFIFILLIHDSYCQENPTKNEKYIVLSSSIYPFSDKDLLSKLNKTQLLKYPEEIRGNILAEEGLLLTDRLYS